jgi:hypothetical protein
MQREMHRIYRAMEQPAVGMSLESPEPCGTKGSGKVLIGGRGRANRSRLPGAASRRYETDNTIVE